MIFAARRFRSKPSDILHIDDGFVAYCFDEACCFIISQLEEGKRPFFMRELSGESAGYSVNSQTIELLKKLGAEVKGFD